MASDVVGVPCGDSHIPKQACYARGVEYAQRVPASTGAVSTIDGSAALYRDEWRGRAHNDGECVVQMQITRHDHVVRDPDRSDLSEADGELPHAADAKRPWQRGNRGAGWCRRVRKSGRRRSERRVR